MRFSLESEINMAKELFPGDRAGMVSTDWPWVTVPTIVHVTSTAPDGSVDVTFK